LPEELKPRIDEQFEEVREGARRSSGKGVSRPSGHAWERWWERKSDFG
jgi:hypothetical protein